MSKLEYLYIAAPGDREIVMKNYEELKLRTDQEILDSCERQAKIGIVGSRSQALYLVALRKVMLERFDETPIYIANDYIIGIN